MCIRDRHYEKDPESFKVPKEFTIHKGGMNYNALVKSFAVFTSDVEVPSKRFNKLTQSFKLIKTYEDVKKLDLPILNVYDDKDTNTKVIEIDLKQRKQIKRVLDTKRLVIQPLLIILMNDNGCKYKDMVYSIKQIVAAKYLNMKLLHSTNNSSTANIDLYNLSLRGFSLDFN